MARRGRREAARRWCNARDPRVSSRVWLPQNTMAQATDHPSERLPFLGRALSAAERVLELGHIRERMQSPADPPGSARSGSGPHQQTETPST